MRGIAGGLTDQDRLGPQWLVVGRRADGSRVVLAERHKLMRAMAVCDRFAQHLEDYEEIFVERIGEGQRLEDLDAAEASAL